MKMKTIMLYMDGHLETEKMSRILIQFGTLQKVKRLHPKHLLLYNGCLLYTSDAADE